MYFLVQYFFLLNSFNNYIESSQKRQNTTAFIQNCRFCEEFKNSTWQISGYSTYQHIIDTTELLIATFYDFLKLGSGRF